MESKRKVLIMAGGTGGHIMPGLALADSLQQEGYDVAWLGRANGMEHDLVNAQAINYFPIVASALRGRSLKQLVKLPWIVIRSLFQAIQVMRQYRPDVVCGFGGYVSAPGGLAAWILRIPLIVHEQNKIPGMSNRSLSKLARVVCESFEGSFNPHKKIKLTGNPVRSAITQITPASIRLLNCEQRPLRLLVLGGSQGAKALNDVVPEALTAFSKKHAIAIRHQSGKAMLGAVQASYQALDLEVTVSAFINDMAEAYEWADCVIARAGATTVAELTVAGVPSILVPYPHAVDDHQTANARVLADSGAAELLPQADLTPPALYNNLLEMMQPERLLTMSKAAQALSHADAANKLSTIVGEYCVKV